MGTLIILAIYTVLILFFVPLKTIAKWQMSTQATVKKWIKKIQD